MTYNNKVNICIRVSLVKRRRQRREILQEVLLAGVIDLAGGRVYLRANVM